MLAKKNQNTFDLIRKGDRDRFLATLIVIIIYVILLVHFKCTFIIIFFIHMALILFILLKPREIKWIKREEREEVLDGWFLKPCNLSHDLGCCNNY